MDNLLSHVQPVIRSPLITPENNIESTKPGVLGNVGHVANHTRLPETLMSVGSGDQSHDTRPPEMVYREYCTSHSQSPASVLV
jgi:hypothetical protein